MVRKGTKHNTKQYRDNFLSWKVLRASFRCFSWGKIWVGRSVLCKNLILCNSDLFLPQSDPVSIKWLGEWVCLKLLRIYRQDCRNLSFYSENSFLKRELLLVDLIIASVAGQREGLSDRSLLWAIGLIHLWQMTAGQLSNYKWYLNMWVINLPTFMSRV